MRLAPVLTSLWLLCLACGAAHAATPATKPDDLSVSDIKPLQSWQSRSKMRLDHIGARHGLDMWIASSDNGLRLIYTTADHQAMLIDGMLIGPNDDDVTTDLQREFVVSHPDLAETMLKSAQPGLPASGAPTAAKTTQPPVKAAEQTKGERLWQDLATAHTINFGPDDAPTAFMIADPTCDHCKALWLKLSPAVNAGRLQLKILPIAILGKEADAAAASLLSAGDPKQDWIDSHTNAAKTTPSPATPEGRAALIANQALASRYKLTSTPSLIYRGQADGKVKLVFGNPADMAGIWLDMGLKPAAAAPVPTDAIPTPFADHAAPADAPTAQP